MLKNFLYKNWQLLFINIAVLFFFSRLFIPEPSTYTNPDFGRTDILHIALPQKLIQSEYIKNFQIPLWENRVGGGHASIPELMSFFFIPNLFLTFLLPFKYAIPTIFLATFLISINSMFYLLHKIRLNKTSAAFGSIAFTFSAAMILRVQHLSLAQTLSLIPLALALNLDFVTKPRIKIGIIFSIILSQVLVTFTQTYLYFVILLTIFNLILLLNHQIKNSYLFFIKYSLIILFSLILSASQLLPSYEAVKKSQRENGLNPASILSDFPLFPRNLKTFFNPFVLGKASNGTYNSINFAQNGIYWENTSYIGLLPFILALFATIYLILKRCKNHYTYFLILALISLILALGKFAPLHFLFSFPPLNFFRVPARFILFTQFFLAILAAYGFDLLSKKTPGKIKFFYPLFLVILILDLFPKWWNYNPIESIDSIFKKPEILNYVQSNNASDYKFFSIGGMQYWNDVFLKSGWENKKDYYKFFRNSLDPNLSIFYDINHFSSYQLLPSKRQNLQQSLITQFTEIKKDSIYLKPPAIKALNIHSIKYLISTLPLEGEFKKIGEVTKDQYKFFLYENQQSKNKFQIYYNYLDINYIEDYIKAFNNDDLSKIVLIENFPSKNLEEGSNTIIINKESSTIYNLTVSTSKDAILVLDDSYSKDWRAKIDNVNKEIYPANINSKAILVPQGKHEVIFYFFPVLTYVGFFITVSAYTFAMWLLLRKAKAG